MSDDMLLARARALLSALNPESVATIATSTGKSPGSSGHLKASNPTSPKNVGSFRGAAIAGSSLITTFMDVRNYIDRGDFIIIDGIKCKTADVGEFTANRIELAEDFQGANNMNAELTFTKNKQRTIKVSRVRMAKDINLSEISKVVETLSEVTKACKEKGKNHDSSQRLVIRQSFATQKKTNQLPILQRLPLDDGANLVRLREASTSSSPVKPVTALVKAIPRVDNDRVNANIDKSTSGIPPIPRTDYGDAGLGEDSDSYMSSYLQGGLHKDADARVREGRERIVRRMLRKIREDETLGAQERLREMERKEVAAEASESRIESFRQKTIDRVMKLKEADLQQTAAREAQQQQQVQRVQRDDGNAKAQVEQAAREQREQQRTRSLPSLRAIKVATSARVRGRMLASLALQQQEEEERQRRLDQRAAQTLRRLPTAELIQLGAGPLQAQGQMDSGSGSGSVGRDRNGYFNANFNDVASQASHPHSSLMRQSASAGRVGVRGYTYSGDNGESSAEIGHANTNGNTNINGNTNTNANININGNWAKIKEPSPYGGYRKANSAGRQLLKEVQQQMRLQEIDDQEGANSLPTLHHHFVSQQQQQQQQPAFVSGSGPGYAQKSNGNGDDKGEEGEDGWSDDSMQGEDPPLPSSSQYHNLIDDSSQSRGRSSHTEGQIEYYNNFENTDYDDDEQDEYESDLRMARSRLKQNKSYPHAVSTASSSGDNGSIRETRAQKRPILPIPIPASVSMTANRIPIPVRTHNVPALLPSMYSTRFVPAEDPLERVSMMSDLSNVSAGSPSHANASSSASNTLRVPTEGGGAGSKDMKKKTSQIWRKLKPIPIQPFANVPA